MNEQAVTAKRCKCRNPECHGYARCTNDATGFMVVTERSEPIPACTHCMEHNAAFFDKVTGLRKGVSA